MLGLATHEIQFLILREQVLFGKKKHDQSYSQDAVLIDKNSLHASAVNPVKKAKPFDFVKLWVLREYLQHEFRPEAFYSGIPFPYDFERCIDDFVFLCFFVGNDFLVGDVLHEFSISSEITALVSRICHLCRLERED